jgi:tetratricopeptide (TPR) repeat protein
MNDKELPSAPQGQSALQESSAAKGSATIPTDSSTTSAVQGEKKARPWYQSPTVIIASLALIVSVVASVATILNNRSTTRYQDQQQLLILVQDLTQIPSQQVTLRRTYANDPATLQNLSASILTSEIVETEEAAQLIATLGNQAPGVEAYEVGYALSSIGNYTQAIQMFSLAASNEGNSLTLAAIYRGWAQVLYTLGELKQARAKIASAYSAANHATGLNRNARTDINVYTAIFQIPEEVTMHNCRYAQKQLQYAVHLLASLPTTDSNLSLYTSDVAHEEQSVKSCS